MLSMRSQKAHAKFMVEWRYALGIRIKTSSPGIVRWDSLMTESEIEELEKNLAENDSCQGDEGRKKC